MREIKSLVSYRAFESAARHLSFKLAAVELSVTPTAISHQVRALERELDCPLFDRRARQVTLTAEGRDLFATVRRALDGIETTTRRIGQRRTRKSVTLGLGPIIASRWLASRLGDFWRRHPDIDLRLHHSPMPIHQRMHDLDLAIAWGDGNWPRLQVEPFTAIEVSPVYARHGVFADVDFRHPRELLDYPLLHQRDRRGWQLWLRAAGVEFEGAAQGSVIDDANVVLQSALDGQGLALGILDFIDRDLASGALQRPFSLSVRPQDAYYLIHRDGSCDRREVEDVILWLRDQIDADGVDPQ